MTEEHQKRIIKTYNKLLSELEKYGMTVYPSREELMEKTGFTEGEIIGAIRGLKKDGNELRISTRRVEAWRKKIQIIEALEKVSSETGKPYDEINNPEIWKYLDFSHNTVQKYRIELENSNILELRKNKKKVIENKENIPELKKKFISVLENNPDITLKEMAHELSTEWWILPKIRDLLEEEGKIPKTFRKGDKYEQIQNIIRVYQKNPNLKITQWTALADVPLGTFYKRIDELAFDPELSGFEIPRGMIEKVRSTPPLERLLAALSNYDRVEILKILATTEEADVEEITGFRGKPNGWTANTLDHLRMLQFAGLVQGPPYSLTSYGKIITENLPQEEYNIGFTSYSRPLILLALSEGDATSRELVKKIKLVKGLEPEVGPLYKETLRPHHHPQIIGPIDGVFLEKKNDVYSLTGKGSGLKPFLKSVEEIAAVIEQPYSGVPGEEIEITVYNMFVELMSGQLGYQKEFIHDVIQRIEEGPANMEELSQIVDTHELRYRDLNRVIYKLQDLGMISIRLPEVGINRREKNVQVIAKEHEDKYERSLNKMRSQTQ